MDTVNQTLQLADGIEKTANNTLIDLKIQGEKLDRTQNRMVDLELGISGESQVATQIDNNAKPEILMKWLTAIVIIGFIGLVFIK
jgi:N-acetylmuramic acid 6-phosphate (MurNAc-6-P) etherase